MPNPVFPGRRDLSIDTLRGLACLALVSFHTVGYSPGTGMEIPADHWLAVLNASFVDMRMPLFSFLSGFVFVALKPQAGLPGQGALRVLRAKARRLLLPLLSVGLLFWGLREAMGYAQGPFWQLLVLPNTHFWFLQASFGIMTCFALLACLRPGHLRQVALGLLAAGALAWLFAPRPALNLFSMVQVWYLMPFFMLGYLCQHTPRLRAVMPRALAALVLLGLVGLGYALAVDRLVLDVPARRGMTLALGGLFCLSLLALRPQIPALAGIGQFSYAIYLFHVFFTAGMQKMAAQAVPDLANGAVWLICLAAGVIGPIIVQQMVMQNGWLAWLLLGLRRPLGRVAPPAPPVAPVAQTVQAQRA